MTFSDTTLFIDIETHSIEERRAHRPEDYFRIGGWSWGEDEEVHITEDYHEFMALFDKATMILAHNGHAFDFRVLFGSESLEPVRLARQRKLCDTLIHATLALPAPFKPYIDNHGVTRPSHKPEHYRKWYKLDNLAYQLGVEGKLFDLNELADRFSHTYEPIILKSGKPSMSKGEPRMRKVPIEGICCGFGNIPTDNEEFREYLRYDVRALRNVARELLRRHPWNFYAQREQVKMACMAQITENGFRVDQDAMNARIYEQSETTAWLLNDLNDKFELPLHKKKPLATDIGKAALLKALDEVGIPESALDVTPNGAPSFSADSLKRAAGYVEVNDVLKPPENGNEAAIHLVEAAATLAGQRSLADLTAESLWEDGFVHPDIMPLQRSGRCSTTKPGLTIWDSSHKDYYLPDSDDDLLVEFDFSNADARAVAAESGDKEYAVRFQPGQDGHLINAIAMWGELKVKASEAMTKFYRQKGKPIGHGWGYKMGPSKMSKMYGIPFAEAKKLLGNLSRAFPGVVRWQQKVSEFALQHGYVINDWGRKMPVEPDREFTQAPALFGQGDTNELLWDGIIRLPERLLLRVKLTIHDAFVMSLAKDTMDEDIATVVRCVSRTWKPKNGGQAIDFPLGYGTPGRNWREAEHD